MASQQIYAVATGSRKMWRILCARVPCDAGDGRELERVRESRVQARLAYWERRLAQPPSAEGRV